MLKTIANIKSNFKKDFLTKIFYGNDKENQACEYFIELPHQAIKSYEEAVKIKDRTFILRKDNPQYSLGQTNGWWLYNQEKEKKIKQFWKN